MDCKIVKGTVDGDLFYNVLQSALLPHLMPFNGVNPYSIVILENASIHHVQGIVGMIIKVGVLVCFFLRTLLTSTLLKKLSQS